MKLIAQFLFLHPNYKRLIEFSSETTLLNFIKYFAAMFCVAIYDKRLEKFPKFCRYYRDKIFKKELMDTLKLELKNFFQKKEDKEIELDVIKHMFLFQFVCFICYIIFSNFEKKVLIPLSKKLSREFGKHCLDHGKM